MAHIHEKIDFTVAIFVVHDEKILLIHHRQLDNGCRSADTSNWTRPGAGRVTRGEGRKCLEVELLGERPPTTGPGTRALIAPRSSTSTASTTLTSTSA